MDEQENVRTEEDESEPTTDFDARFWFLMEFTNGAVRMVECDDDEDGIADAIQRGEPFTTHRIIYPVVEPGEAIGQSAMTFMLGDAACPPWALADDERYMRMNGSNVLRFQPIAEDSDMWNEIKRNVLRDTNIVLPNRIQFPGTNGPGQA
jgi:hypothetical protein